MGLSLLPVCCSVVPNVRGISVCLVGCLLAQGVMMSMAFSKGAADNVLCSLVNSFGVITLGVFLGGPGSRG